MSKRLTLSVLVVTGFAAALSAAETPKAPSPPTGPDVTSRARSTSEADKKEQWMRLPKPESSVTQHHFALRGKSLDYTATAGTLIIRDDEDKPTASIGYVAYIAPRPRAAARAPLRSPSTAAPAPPRCGCTWACWDPKRVGGPNPDPTPAGPYRTVDNEFGAARQERPGDDRPGRHRPQPRGLRSQGRGILGRRPGHRFDQPLHRAVRERQQPLDLAEVPAGRELRHDARRGHRQLPARTARRVASTA